MDRRNHLLDRLVRRDRRRQADLLTRIDFARRQRPARDGTHRRFIQRALIVLLLAVLTLALWRLRELVMLVFGSVVVAAIFNSIASLVCRHTPLRHAAAVAVAVLTVLGLIAACGYLFGAEVGTQARALGELLPAAWESLQRRVDALPFGTRLTGWAQDAVPGSSGIVSTLGGLFLSLGGGITDAIVMIVGGIYLAAQPGLYRRGLVLLLPARRRALTDDALLDSGRALQLWLRGQLVSMGVVGVLTGLGLWAIGVPSALTLGILSGLLDFVPIVGPIVAAVPAVLLALAESPQAALWTVGLFVLIQQVEGNLLAPLVQKHAVDLPPALLLFSVIGFGLLFGVMGVLLAAPLTVVAFVLVKRLYVREALHTPTAVPGEEPRTP